MVGLALCAGAAIAGFSALKSKPAATDEKLDYARTMLLEKGDRKSVV